MGDLLHTLKDTLLNPEWYITNGGLYMILFVIFAETGLFVGFFLPGDSLLFVAGIFLDQLPAELGGGVHFVMVMVLISIAGVLGNYVGYWFGRKSGPFLYSRKDTFFWKKKHLMTAQDFYNKNGAFTIVAARFVPIIRTFAPIVAGVVKMDFKKFSFYNIVGSFGWVFSMMLAGRFLHRWILNTWGIDITHKLEIIVLVIIIVTTAPVLIKFLKPSKEKKEA